MKLNEMERFAKWYENNSNLPLSGFGILHSAAVTNILEAKRLLDEALKELQDPPTCSDPFLHASGLVDEASCCISVAYDALEAFESYNEYELRERNKDSK